MTSSRNDGVTSKRHRHRPGHRPRPRPRPRMRNRVSRNINLRKPVERSRSLIKLRLPVQVPHQSPASSRRLQRKVKSLQKPKKQRRVKGNGIGPVNATGTHRFQRRSKNGSHQNQFPSWRSHGLPIEMKRRTNENQIGRSIQVTSTTL